MSSRNSMAKYNGLPAAENAEYTQTGSVVDPHPTWTRYNDYFLKQEGYDTTGIALSIDIIHLGQFSCTLISNRHVLFARHVIQPRETVSAAAATVGSGPFVPPLYVYFVNNDNVTKRYEVTRVVAIGEQLLPGTMQGLSDISIGYLNQIVDSTLKFVKVVPVNFLDYLQTSFIGGFVEAADGENYTQVAQSLGTQFISPGLPVFYNKIGHYTSPRSPAGGSTDFVHRTCCGVLKISLRSHLQWELSSNRASSLAYYFPNTGARYNNSDIIRFGDSGSLVFIPINNEIVMLGTWWTGDGVVKTPGGVIGGSSFVAPYINEINIAMTALAGGTSYSLTQVNLHGFKTF